MAGIVVRVVAIAFAIIQAALLIRLVLPFVATVPKGLRPLVEKLVEFTDTLIAPFRGAAHPFELGRLTDLPSGVTTILREYTQRLDPAVLIAMIAWGLIGAIVLLVLRLALRP
jgi:hypothetical protein